MKKIRSFNKPSQSIEERLLSTNNIDYKNCLERIKKVISEPCEDGEYEIDLFRPERRENDIHPNSGLSHVGLLKKYQSEDWQFGTLDHLISLVEADKIGIISETKGVPIVAVGSWDSELRCPTIYTNCCGDELLLELSDSWFFETMPYFLRLRRS